MDTVLPAVMKSVPAFRNGFGQEIFEDGSHGFVGALFIFQYLGRLFRENENEISEGSLDDGALVLIHDSTLLGRLFR
jgi:hypothetical protein